MTELSAGLRPKLGGTQGVNGTHHGIKHAPSRDIVEIIKSCRLDCGDISEQQGSWFVDKISLRLGGTVWTWLSYSTVNNVT